MVMARLFGQTEASTLVSGVTTADRALGSLDLEIGRQGMRGCGLMGNMMERAS
jgi:hypothetical protein